MSTTEPASSENCVEIAGKLIGLTPESFVGILLGAIIGSLIVSNVLSILITWKLTKRKYCKPEANFHYKAQLNNPSVVDSKNDQNGRCYSNKDQSDEMVIANDNVFENDKENKNNAQQSGKYLVAMNDETDKDNNRFNARRKSMESVPDWELINSTLPRDILSSGKTRQPLDLVDGSNYVPEGESDPDPLASRSAAEDETFPPPPM